MSGVRAELAGILNIPEGMADEANELRSAALQVETIHAFELALLGKADAATLPSSSPPTTSRLR